MNKTKYHFLGLILVFSVCARAEEIVLELPNKYSLHDDNRDAQLDSSVTISIDYPNEDIRKILLDVAAQFDFEVKIPEDLNGRTSVRLRDITWRQIYDVLLNPFGYAYIERDGFVEILAEEAFDSLPLVRYEFKCIFIKPNELIKYYGDSLPLRKRFKERLDVDGQSLFVHAHPSNLVLWKKLFRQADTPRRIPHFPTTLHWPDSIPQAVIDSEENHFRADSNYGPRVIPLDWIQARVMRAKLLAFLPSQEDSIRIDIRSNSVIVSADLQTQQKIYRVAKYLDQRKWYLFKAEQEAVVDSAIIP